MDDYRLWIGEYSGTAGDAILYSRNDDWNLNGMKFSTKDHDNDYHSSNCATKFGGGGWWYNYCMASNLNGHNHANGITGRAGDGIYWYSTEWSTDIKRSLKKVTMAIKPNNV